MGRRVTIRCLLVGENSGSAGQPAAGPAPAKTESDDEAFLREARSLGATVKRIDRS